MDRRYWLAKDCIETLQNLRMPHDEQLCLEIKLLRLALLLLRREDQTDDRGFKALYSKLRTYDGHLENYSELSQHVDSLVASVNAEIVKEK